MSSIPCFDKNGLEKMARILGEAVDGGQLTELFGDCGIQDVSGQSTKWRRIYHTLLSRQEQDKCGNDVAAFIRAAMKPVRFSDSGAFESSRKELNVRLAFEGLELGEQGQLRRVPVAETLPEAEERAQVLVAKLKGRSIHPEAMRFCRAQLMQDNYFHAVFEATKSLAQRIRDKTGLEADGAALVDEAFSLKKPLMAFNRLQTESEQSEHKGFAMLLKGCFSAVRNPLAHEPNILWKGEDDAADYLTLISLLHRKLDVARVVR